MKTGIEKEIRETLKDFNIILDQLKSLFRKSNIKSSVGNLGSKIRIRRQNSKPSKTLEELNTWFRKEIVK